MSDHATCNCARYDVPIPLPCTCGPDLTGEAPDERPDCPQHGTLTSMLRKIPDCGEAPF